MAVRFVFGRSGSGKTWRCLEAVRAELRRSAIDGPPLILLVPEQASLQIERALIETGDLAGFTRCEVLSFRRLAQRLFEQAGGLTRTVLSRAGRQMVLRYLLERHQAELRFFGRVRDRAGLAGRLGRTVRELIEQEVRPESLGAVPAELLSESPVLAAKLADLRVIYGAYLEYLGRDRADPAEQLSLARQRLEQCQWLRGALVWVDGFAGFTVQQREFLVGLARQAERMEIALLMDPQAAVIERADEPIEPFDLFAPTEQTYLQLRGRLLAEGLSIEPPVRLVDRPGRRFAGSPVLARLEESLWSGGGVGERPEGIGDAVRLVEAPNRRAEVDAAVREILRLTRDGQPPLRYRDIAVIVRELEPYHDLLAACLGEHDVPFFIDRRQPTGHHPVVRLVRSAMVVLEEDLSVRAVGELLKTGLSGLTDEQADQLENYVLAQGIAGREAWGGPDWRYQRYFRRGREEDRPSEADRQELREINDSRRRLMDVLGEWLEPGAEARLTVREWSARLCELMERLGVPRRLGQWFEDARRAGALEEADEHQQVWRDLMELLDDVVDALGQERMTAGQFRRVLEAALADLSLALAPPRLDQVLVGSIERSRHPEIKVALVLGLSDRFFPLVGQEDSVLDDEDRSLLGQAGIELAATARQRLLQERLLGYIAMTRAGQMLWLSWPASDEQGKAMQPSPFIAELQRSFGELPVERIADASVEPRMEAVSTAQRLAGQTAMALRRMAGGRLEELERARWLGLYEWGLNDAGARAALERVMPALAYRSQAGLSEAAVVKLYGRRGELVSSVSQLERYAACPFAHFANYVLRLQERQQFEVGALDLGSLYHRVLEGFTSQLLRDGWSLAELDAQTMYRRLEQATAEAVSELHDEVMLADAAKAFVLNRSARHLRAVVRAHGFFARGSRFRPRQVEVVFGDGPGATLPGLVIETPKGRRVRVRGKIDRVDIVWQGERAAGVVVDYKRSSGQKLVLSEVVCGLALQLLGYLLVVQEHGQRLAGRPVEPAGTFYAPLSAEYKREQTYPRGDASEAVLARPFRLRGVFDFSYLPVLDEEASRGWSQRVLAFVTQDGRPGNVGRSDVASRQELQRLLEHVRAKMGELADRIMDGDIAVRPVRLGEWMACRWCVFRWVCRFEFGISELREVRASGRREVLEELADRASGRCDG